MTTASNKPAGADGGEISENEIREIVKDKLKLNAPGLSDCTRTAIARSIAMSVSAALASTARAGTWRSMDTAPSDTPIVARHKPNSRTPHGWVATISRTPEDPDDRVGGLDTILHYNGDALMRGFHGVWVGWMYPEEFAALALSAGTLSVGWDGARDAFARIVEDRAWTAEHGEPRAACLRAAADIRQAKAPAVPASPRSGAGEGEESAAVMNQLTAEAISADVQWLHEAVPVMKAFENGYAAAEERLSASSPTPAEHGVEIRELCDRLDRLNTVRDPQACADAMCEARTMILALSQGGGAGRSERAVEIRELSEKATQGPWVYRPDRYDDWGFIRAPRSAADMPGEVVAISRGEGHDTFAAHRKAGTDPYEANGRFIVALANAFRSGRLVIAPCDRSGEAGETSGLDPQGESTVTGAARQAPSNPMQEVIAETVERAGRDPAQAFLRETLARRDAARSAVTETKEGSDAR